ncbi:low molecular weight protein tyrosine phosphatase family protein [Serratia fonticola]|uniref:low molecular weight protein tyrosine phosphatase family protein n=1 Tax=Serratia fonticola TaxID=47917 RepID=UPI000BA1CAC0|nr:phosphotyrosine protein phosphatase [Serratia fonticola]PAA99123.1 phosphotyrosine protein phosphatase [Serratia fonticola]
MNVLFVCSRNQWRSPTAERIWQRTPGLTTNSAGTSRNAKKTVTPELLRWTDMIFVMEQKHKSRLVAEYQRLLEHKPLHVLDIPDDYQYMDPELITLLEQSAGPFLAPFILK